MSQPRRLLSDAGATPFERELLESWQREQPSSAARDRALALGAAAAGSLVAAGASSGAKTVAWTTACAKWAIAATIAGASIIAGVVAWPMREPAPSSMAATTAPPAAAPALGTTTTTPLPPDPPETISPSDLPSVASTRLPAPSPPARGTTMTAGSGGLEDEISAFDAARSALTANDVEGALRLLDTYQRRFPRGTFAQEAEVLRIEALTRKNDHTGAALAAARFLEAHPGSPHAAKVRSMLRASAPTSN